jgi:transposase
MAKHRTHSIEFKRQVVQEFLGGESYDALAKRHGISRNLIKIWVAKYEAGGLDSDLAAADVLADYEARIAALERLVGKLALENEFLKGASRHVRQLKSASTSVVHHRDWDDRAQPRQQLRGSARDHADRAARRRHATC